jgi:alpha-glucosidase
MIGVLKHNDRLQKPYRRALSLSIFAGLLLASVSFEAQAEKVRLVTSPDNRLHVSIQMPAPGASEQPFWSCTFQGKEIVTNCFLGLQTPDDGELLAGVRVVRERNRSIHQRIRVLFGKADHADDNFHESRFTLETPRHRRFDVTFRCYNDAVAFRYELPEDTQRHTVTIMDETTSFRVAGNPTAYAQYLENYNTSHEHNVTRARYHELKPDVLLDLPLAFSWEDGTYAAITEASLRHYAGMSLKRPASGNFQDDLVCQLTPRPDGSKVERPLPMQSPWRVLLVGDHPGALLESCTLYCLNEPSVIGDTSWIKPGKITFSWWNGDVFDGKSGPPILSFEMAKKYIDFCASNGIPTHSLTSKEGDPIYPWYYQSNPSVVPGPDTDVTRPRADFDLPRIRAYALSKQVRLWTWVHQGALRGKVEQAFTAFEKMGWSGMMVDFFDHDDQESIELAESILQSAARHHIVIHLHGVWKPSGWQRTYPNLMNHEGALNLEYLKWSDRCTPEHDLMLAFTRLIAGPMDYHLGGFRAVTRAEFQPHFIAPNVLGTRCRQLAMYVCFDNPNPMVADYPTAYEGQPGFDFLRLVPTWWDETRILEGQPGEILVTARRRGQTWYLGGMSAKQPRQLTLPLTFLNAGQHRVDLWQDADDADTNPNHLATATLNMSARDTLKIQLAVDGGFVAQIAPMPK